MKLLVVIGIFTLLVAVKAADWESIASAYGVDCRGIGAGVEEEDINSDGKAMCLFDPGFRSFLDTSHCASALPARHNVHKYCLDAVSWHIANGDPTDVELHLSRGGAPICVPAAAMTRSFLQRSIEVSPTAKTAFIWWGYNIFGQVIEFLQSGNADTHSTYSRQSERVCTAAETAEISVASVAVEDKVMHMNFSTGITSTATTTISGRLHSVGRFQSNPSLILRFDSTNCFVGGDVGISSIPGSDGDFEWTATAGCTYSKHVFTADRDFFTVAVTASASATPVDGSAPLYDQTTAYITISASSNPTPFPPKSGPVVTLLPTVLSLVQSSESEAIQTPNSAIVFNAYMQNVAAAEVLFDPACIEITPARMASPANRFDFVGNCVQDQLSAPETCNLTVRGYSVDGQKSHVKSTMVTCRPEDTPPPHTRISVALPERSCTGYGFSATFDVANCVSGTQLSYSVTAAESVTCSVSRQAQFQTCEIHCAGRWNQTGSGRISVTAAYAHFTSTESTTTSVVDCDASSNADGKSSTQSRALFSRMATKQCTGEQVASCAKFAQPSSEIFFGSSVLANGDKVVGCHASPDPLPHLNTSAVEERCNKAFHCTTHAPIDPDRRCAVKGSDTTTRCDEVDSCDDGSSFPCKPPCDGIECVDVNTWGMIGGIVAGVVLVGAFVTVWRQRRSSKRCR